MNLMYINGCCVECKYDHDELSKRISYPLVSIPKTVSEEVVLAGITRVGLLGTVFTMELDFMKKDLISEGVQVFVPDAKERE